MTPALDFEGPVEVPFEPWDPATLAAGVIARFCRAADEWSAMLAIDDDEGQWTYAELASAAENVRCEVERAGIGAAEPVAIEAGHSRFTAAAILGVLAAGRPYVPLDPSFPAERNRHIREHSGAELWLTRARVEECCQTRPSATLTPPTVPAGENIAYVIYTSGSTGKPKGVYQNQQNLLHDVMQYIHSIHLSHRDRATMLYSPSVGGSLRDLFGALLTGASLHMHSVRDAGLARLGERIAATRITVYHSVPPAFRALLSEGDFFDSVRLVYLAGDRLLRADVERFRRHFARGAKLYTGIGSTEAATLYRQWFIDHDTPLPDTPGVPVGRAIPDRPMSLATDGEIEVSGPYLALGYWRDPAQTALRFRPVPGSHPAARAFRPGDRGRELAGGLLEFLGRADQQVKVRGHRIELAEVESAMSAHPGAAEVAVVFTGENLRAFYTSAAPIAWPEFLTPRLPVHMIPARFERLAEMPRLGNFKLDRAALASLRLPPEETPTASPRPEAGSLEATVAEVFAALLGLPEVGIDDDFAALGADSLLALRLPLELEQRLGHSIALECCQERPVTPRSVAARIREGENDRRPILLYCPGIEGSPATALVLKRAFDGFRVLPLAYPQVQVRSIPELAAEVRANLRRQGLRGPYRIVGYSFGGRLAYELARQLAEEGEAVPFLCVLDTPPVGHLARGHTGVLLRILRFGRRLLTAPVRLWPRIIRHSLARESTRSTHPAPDHGRRAAYLAYQPQPYDGELVLIRSRGENLGWDTLPDHLGWAEWCPRTRVRYFQGTHDITNPWSEESLNRAAGEELRRDASSAPAVAASQPQPA